MIRALVLVGGAVLVSNPLGAQAQGPRSGDYLFASTAQDARALWVNPAGTQFGARASLMAEIVVDRSIPDSTRVGQWSVALATRAFSFGYQRDQLRNDSSNTAVRIGLASRFTRGAVGVATTFHKSDSTSRGVDIGLTYYLSPPVTLGVVLRNIGKPDVRGVELPFTGVVGLGWTGPGGLLTVAGELIAADRFQESGYDLGYRAGAKISLGAQLPVSAALAIQLDDDFDVGMFTLGVSVGLDRRLVAMGSARRLDGTTDLDAISLTGVALNRTGTVVRR